MNRKCYVVRGIGEHPLRAKVPLFTINNKTYDVIHTKMKVFQDIYGCPKDIQNHIFSRCRKYSGLLAYMEETYRDFHIHEIVTIIYFRGD